MAETRTVQSVEAHRAKNFISALRHGMRTTGFTELYVAQMAKIDLVRLSNILATITLPSELEMANLAKVMNGMSPDKLVDTWKKSCEGETAP